MKHDQVIAVQKNYSTKYPIIGLGVGFLCVATVFLLSQWLLVAIPFLLAGLFYMTGKKADRWKATAKSGYKKNEHQWNLLNNFVASLNSGDSAVQLSEDFENPESQSLLHNFRDKLKLDKQADEQRAWSANGMTRFSELLRSTTDISKLCDEAISFVVNYTNSNQGSLFLVRGEGDSRMLELKATYAYNRKKYVTSSIEPGEGLVGQCFLEGTIRLLQVPADYVKITSGLGEALPRSVVLVPIKTDDVVLGVLEIASFNEHAPNTIQFLENVAEALASTIHTLSTNDHIRELLQNSQGQTEELRAQEEEMRQNMEELQAIQEQLSRQLSENTEVKSQLEARESVLGLTTIMSESDLYGTITFINSKFSEVSQYNPEELIGKPHNILRHDDMPAEVFKLMWSTIKKGNVFQGIVKNKKKDGTHYWVDATIVPIFENNKIIKYIGARYHIQDDSMAEKLFREQLERLGLSKPVEAEIENVFQ